MADLYEDPDFRSFTNKVRAELLPLIAESAINVSICPASGEDVDIKFAVELGLSILLDKPIIVAVPPGHSMPDGLARVAHEIIELTDNPEASSARIAEAIKRVADRRIDD